MTGPNNTDRLRKGWCPGALRPMLSGDGLLLRVRPRAGTFSIAALAAIADAASRFGSGEIDLTNRANLQLRGVTDAAYPAALTALDDAGLIDGEAGAEAVRNIVVDPLSGLDPDRANVRAHAVELEDRLVGDRRFWSLPGKFGFSLSGSGEPHVGGRSADIMLAAAPGGSISIWLDGDRTTCAELPFESAIDAALSVADVFSTMNAADQNTRRMRDAVQRYGAAAIFANAGLAAFIARASEFPCPPPQVVGVLGDEAGHVFAAGIGLPYGRIRAAELDALCETAAQLGVETVHASPERGLVFATPDVAKATALQARAAKLGLITAPDDARLAIDVCPGAPGCSNTENATRQDAQRLVATLNGTLTGISMHISGCSKGCARRGAAGITLVGRDGRYDIIRNGGPDGAVAMAAVAPADIAATVARLIAEQPR